jgi:hypothetical protein
LAIREAKQVGCHPHLTITARSSSDADHGNGEPPAELRGQAVGDVFYHQGETSPGLQGQGLLQQTLLGARIGGLAPQAQTMDRLGGEAQMAHHRDPHPHHPIGSLQGLRLGSLDLHGGRWALLQHPPRGGHGPIQAALIAEEGQIADQQGSFPTHPAQASTHGPAVMKHFVQRHRQGGGMAQGRHGQGIAHKNGIGPRFTHDGC